MNYRKGFVALWVIVLVIFIAGGAYWYWSQHSTQPTTSATTETPIVQPDTTGAQATPSANLTSQSAPAQTNPTPSATVDQSSLTTASASPTITGTVSNTTSIAVVVSTKPLTSQLTVYGNQTPQGIGIVWHDPSDHVGTVKIADHKYSDSISENLSVYGSTYYVGIYNRVVQQDGLHYTETLLASGTLKLQ